MPQPDKKRYSGKPKWLRKTLPSGPGYQELRGKINSRKLCTVCSAAKCPNQFECFAKGTATFMILGERCSRNCGFCAVGHGPQGRPDPTEPQRVAAAILEMGLDYAVITSVTRDDLDDGGAAVFADTLRAIRKAVPGILIELLVPDFAGNKEACRTVFAAGPDVLNHNIETVPRLYSRVRGQADFARSLKLLEMAKEYNPEIITKSGIMVGLGEEPWELRKTWRQLLSVQCDILTLGQYLQPRADCLEVERFVSPQEFDELRQQALDDGFAGVAASPFVRSSYEAKELFYSAKKRSL